MKTATLTLYLPAGNPRTFDVLNPVGVEDWLRDGEWQTAPIRTTTGLLFVQASEVAAFHLELVQSKAEEVDSEG